MTEQLNRRSFVSAQIINDKLAGRRSQQGGVEAIVFLSEAHINVAIGFAFVPLLVAAMAGFTIATAQGVTPPDLAMVETLGDAISFIVIMLLGAGLMVLVPSFAQSLAATNIGLAGVAANAAGLAKGAGRSALGGSIGFARGAAGQKVSPLASTSVKTGNVIGRGARGASVAAINVARRMKNG